MRRRVDDNHLEIDQALILAGAVVIRTTEDPEIGFDDLVCYQGRVYLAEIKNPSLPPSKRRLTPNEQFRHEQLRSVGVTIHIWETPEDALRTIGALK